MTTIQLKKRALNPKLWKYEYVKDKSITVAYNVYDLSKKVKKTIGHCKKYYNNLGRAEGKKEYAF